MPQASRGFLGNDDCMGQRSENVIRRAALVPQDTRRAGTAVRTGPVTLAGGGLVQANGSSNEGRESLLIDFIVLVEVDCAPGVAFEA